METQCFCNVKLEETGSDNIDGDLYSVMKQCNRCGAMYLTRPNWGWWETQKGHMINKVGARCVGCSGEDAQQPYCFLSLLISSLYSASFPYLFFKALLLYSSLKPCF
jgi:hypothetical protein